MTKSILHRHLVLRAAAAAVCASFASGCATDPTTGMPSLKETFASKDPCSQNARNIGIGIGVLAGALLGKQVGGSNKGLLLGAALGGAIGGLVGSDIDKRRCELAKIAKQYDLDMQISALNAAGEVVSDVAPNANASEARKNAVGSIVEIRDLTGEGGQFESNSDKLTVRAQLYFAAIANTYNAKNTAAQIQDAKLRTEYLAKITQRKILLIGHTDDTGSSKINADLSERRARAVSKFMEDRGIPKDSLYFQGAGEFYPVADNRTEEGRARNRRVEIVEVSDQAGFDNYLASRTPRYEFYRSREEIAVETVTPAIPANPQTKKTSTKAVSANIADKNGTVPPPSAPIVTASNSRTPASRTASRPDNFIDFGGTPLAAANAVTDIGKRESGRSFFSMISPAYADEPRLASDCTRDRPRIANGVKALSDGKAYKTSEYIPGLYGKTWTDQVNGHQIVVNKVAVLSGDGSLANPPEFKIYTNYNPSKSGSAVPDLMVKPEVNTYLGSKGVLYRMFINGQAGVECVDIVFEKNGGTAARAGKLVYTHAAQQYVADFKPKMY